MGSQLRWLERTPDKREVDGSIPFEPTKTYYKKVKIGIAKILIFMYNMKSTLKNIQMNDL